MIFNSISVISRLPKTDYTNTSLSAGSREGTIIVSVLYDALILFLAVIHGLIALGKLNANKTFEISSVLILIGAALLITGLGFPYAIGVVMFGIVGNVLGSIRMISNRNKKTV